MKATKYTVIITAQALSLDAIPSLIYEAAEKLRNEKGRGEIFMEDGDNVNWYIEKKDVDF